MTLSKLRGDLRNAPGNNPALFDKLLPEQQRALLEWISASIKRAGRRGSSDSYHLKHCFEKSSGGFYVTNGEFKGAMRAAGWKAYPDDQNINDFYAARLTPEAHREVYGA